MSFFTDQDHIKRERQKARDARKLRWWQVKTAPGICYYCQQNVGIKSLTLDHIIPLARGGRTAPGNCVPACRECNKKKGMDIIVESLI